MQKDKIMRKRNVLLFQIFILLMLMLTGCSLKQEKLRRKNPYTKDEMESYLEEQYKIDVTILSRKEIYSLNSLEKIEYEVQIASDTAAVFLAYDKNDGVAGWTLYDEYGALLQNNENNKNPENSETDTE